MKKTLLSLAFLGAIFSADAQTTTIFQNNFDTTTADLVNLDFDGDGDGGFANWQGAPPASVGFPSVYSGGIMVLDGALKAGGAYNSDFGFDFNTIGTKNTVTIPAGGTAQLSFDLLAFKRSADYSTVIYLTLYDADFNQIAQYDSPISSGTYKNVKFSIPEGLGNSYIYERAQYDDPAVQSEFVIDNLKITHTPALSNNDFISSKFSISHNPANDLLTIANADNMLVNGVTITDLNGRNVKKVSFDGVANAQVNVSDLASGLYIINVTSDKGIATKKFVKN